MPKFNKTIHAPFSPEQMYALVVDVKRYPEFIPNCSDVVVFSSDDSVQVVELTFERAGVSQSFTTRNVKTPSKSLGVTLVDGPFNLLEGQWTFEASSEGCVVDLALEYRFSNPLLSIVMNQEFERLTAQQCDAFLKRAGQLYES